MPGPIVLPLRRRSLAQKDRTKVPAPRCFEGREGRRKCQVAVSISAQMEGKSSRGTSSHPTEGESSSGIPASPSSARRGKPTPEAEDEDVESLPSHPSQIEGDEDDAPDTDPAT